MPQIIWSGVIQNFYIFVTCKTPPEMRGTGTGNFASVYIYDLQIKVNTQSNLRFRDINGTCISNLEFICILTVTTRWKRLKMSNVNNDEEHKGRHTHELQNLRKFLLN